MYVKGKGKGNVKGAWPKGKGNGKGKDGKAQRGEFNGKCWHCGDIGHPEFLCPKKNPATRAANAVTKEQNWSLMLHDEPPPLPVAQSADDDSAWTSVGPNSQPILPVLTQQEVQTTGFKFFDPSRQPDPQEYPEPTAQQPQRPAPPPAVIPTYNELNAMIESAKSQIVARRRSDKKQSPKKATKPETHFGSQCSSPCCSKNTPRTPMFHIQPTQASMPLCQQRLPQPRRHTQHKPTQASMPP